MAIESLLSITESIVTIGAIIIGGIWGYLLFVKNREKFPKADISHDIEIVKIGSELLIRLTIEIENLGKVILPIKSGEVRLQQIQPIDDFVSNAITDFSIKESSIKSDIAWPLIEKRILKFQEDNSYELEPGEKDYFEFDFIIKNDIEVIQFYTHIVNIGKKDKGWNFTSIHNL